MGFSQPASPRHCQPGGAISAGQANPGFTATAARTISRQGCDLAGEPMTDYAPLTLHVPEPEVRPGGTPDFSGVPVPRPDRSRGRRSTPIPEIDP